MQSNIETSDHEEPCRELLRSVDCVLTLVSLDDRRPLYVSPAYGEIWGTPAEAAYRDPDFLMAGIHPDDRERVSAALSRLPEAAGPVEYRVVRPDGTTRWVSTRWTPEQRPRERRRVVGISEDVTSRKRSEAECERVMEAVVHDLRSPVTAVLLSADSALCALGEGNPAGAARALRMVVDAAEQMQGLLADLLDATTLAGGGTRLRISECDTGELIRAAVGRIRPLADARGIRIGTGIAEGLRARVDEGRILQVMANLLGNAVKFTPGGGTIEVGAERRGERVWISVSDSGPGVPEQHLPRLFDRYWRTDHAAPAGSGVGLAIAKQIVEAHGGSIWVTSTPPEGSTFVFSIPAGDRSAAA